MSRYDYPDPGTDPAYCNGLSGPPNQPIVLTCAVCAFKGDFCAAVAHYRVTGHELTYKGTVQRLDEVGR